jgi:hypothetical protein
VGIRPVGEGGESVEHVWDQLEEVVQRLHEMARTPIGEQAFYRQLCDQASAALGGCGGAAWQWDAQQHRPQLIGEWIGSTASAQLLPRPDRVALACQTVSAADHPLPTHDGNHAAADNSPLTHVMVAVKLAGRGQPPPPGEGAVSGVPVAVIELVLPVAENALVRGGRAEVAAALAEAAADFHAFSQLRQLTAGSRLQQEAVSLLHRVHGAADVEPSAFAIAN